MTKILTILCLNVFVLQAQDITNKLGGDTANETYDVTDSADNVLFRVQGDGKVGVGTETPDELLQIDGNMRLDGIFEDKDGDAGASGQILSSTATGTDWINAPSGADNLGNHTATQALNASGFNINLNGGRLSGDGGTNEGIIIDNSGNVGIGWGAGTPLSTLHVDGTLTVDNYIQAEDTGGLQLRTSDGTSRIYMYDSGNVSIGTASSGNILRVEGTTSSGQPTVYVKQLGTFGGIYGESADGYGVKGQSTSNYGVVGYSTSSHGVEGRSTSSRGVYGLSTSGDGVYGQSSGAGDGVDGFSQTGNGVYGRSVDGIAIYGQGGNSWAGYFAGNVTITGGLYKGAGSFKIDHPQDPTNKYLIHSFVESPDMMNIYNGTVILDNKGNADVELPHYFESLNRDFRYQLTCIGGFAQVYIAEEIAGNNFKIAGGTPGLKVSWQVTGVRQDPYAIQNPIIVEDDKTGDEIGKYLHPEAYGLPEVMGINHDDN